VRAGPRPRVAILAGCRGLARMLTAGELAEPLGVPAGWPATCSGELIAALHARHPPTEEGAATWRDLVEQILAARAVEGLPAPAAPPPASEAAIAEAEWRLCVGLPADYREFLATCDGLPADVVFPRLLAAEELAGEGRAVLVSERGRGCVIVLAATTDSPPAWGAVEHDAELGPTAHRSFRALMEHHLRLLLAAGGA
jgi:hypothetical protein